jgi:hypothetical protein
MPGFWCACVNLMRGAIMAVIAKDVDAGAGSWVCQCLHRRSHPRERRDLLSATPIQEHSATPPHALRNDRVS